MSLFSIFCYIFGIDPKDLEFECCPMCDAMKDINEYFEEEERQLEEEKKNL